MGGAHAAGWVPQVYMCTLYVLDYDYICTSVKMTITYGEKHRCIDFATNVYRCRNVSIYCFMDCSNTEPLYFIHRDNSTYADIH